MYIILSKVYRVEPVLNFGSGWLPYNFNYFEGKSWYVFKRTISKKNLEERIYLFSPDVPYSHWFPTLDIEITKKFFVIREKIDLNLNPRVLKCIEIIKRHYAF